MARWGEPAAWVTVFRVFEKFENDPELKLGNWPLILTGPLPVVGGMAMVQNLLAAFRYRDDRLGRSFELVALKILLETKGLD